MKRSLTSGTVAVVSTCIVGLVAVDPASAHRIHTKPIAKLTTKQLRQENTHAASVVRFFNRTLKGRYAAAVSHRKKCWQLRTMRPQRRALCFRARESLRDHAWLLRVTRHRLRPPEVVAALRWWRSSGAPCVKSHEGAWTSNTGNGYYGGFQADLSFQTAYGREFYRRWGTANNWPSWAQIVMAYRGWRARGWHPWPNTARMCGLL
jgi:Transglycosylase-like domain